MNAPLANGTFYAFWIPIDRRAATVEVQYEDHTGWHKFDQDVSQYAKDGGRYLEKRRFGFLADDPIKYTVFDADGKILVDGTAVPE